MDIKYIALIIALLVSTVSMPLIILFSKKFNLYDTVDGRKVHTGQISRLGGLGITLAFSIALIILLVSGYFADIKQNILFLVLAAICITAMGIIDDIVTLPAKIKIVPQIIASTLVLVGGFKFTTLSLGIYTINLGLLAFPLTFVWIIGVTNAVNLIDGIDGQCGGISVVVDVEVASWDDNGDFAAVDTGFPNGVSLEFHIDEAVGDRLHEQVGRYSYVSECETSIDVECGSCKLSHSANGRVFLQHFYLPVTECGLRAYKVCQSRESVYWF